MKRRPTDKSRIDFMQNHLRGKVIIASADAEGVITFMAQGRGLRQAIDDAMRQEGR